MVKNMLEKKKKERKENEERKEGEGERTQYDELFGNFNS